MRGGRDRLERFVESLLRDRRPHRAASEDDAEARAMLAAAALRAGRPGADSPSPQFVEQLERRLAAAVRDEPRDTVRMSRRRLLGGSVAAAAAAVAAGIGIDRAVIERSEHLAPSAELIPDSGTWTDVAAIADVRVGRPLRFSAGAVEGFVVNHGDRVQALSAICTHMPCTLHFNAGTRRLDCPCHGAAFNLDGAPVDPAYAYGVQLRSLPELRTRVVGGRIQVLTA